MIPLLIPLAPSGLPLLPGSSDLCGLLVFPVHCHALSGEDMSQGTFVTELAGALDEPRAYVLWVRVRVVRVSR